MFEKSTWIRLPRNVLVGHGVLDRTVEAIEELHLAGTPLLVTSPTPRAVAAEPLVEQFRDAGVEPEVLVVETASFGAVQRVIDAAEDYEAGYLVGVGGGKAIDIAKMAADDHGCGFVSVPTAASHDGIVSGRGSIAE
ncbi:MAG: NAD(P)-dependent glycerol-1-phosphate dehydrogenase, partial [Halobacteriales archaeon SW_9_67_25]